MALILEDRELEALEGLEAKYFKLYYIIKQYMDFKTGVTGIRRRISHQALKEMMWVEPVKGVFTKPYTVQQIRRMEKCLVRSGLLEPIKTTQYCLIFKHPLARWDQSVQNKADTRPTPLADSVGSQNRQKKAKSYKRDNSQGDTLNRGQADIPPISYVNTNKDNTTVIVSHSSKGRPLKKYSQRNGFGRKPETPHQRITREYTQGIRDYEQQHGLLWQRENS